jgi:glycosyltransferase involved in cell wall biosynthesis
MLWFSPVRVLIDYRSALRERSGVGEYTHQLVVSLLEMTAREHNLDLTIFSSSWKDRLDTADLAREGARTIDRRVPVQLLNLAWHRLGWPPAELVAGGQFDVTHSDHPLILPSRAAAHLITIHDLNFLTHPERTRAEIRRDYPALVRAHARRADRIIAPSLFTVGEIERLLEVGRDRISVCPPGAPDWPPRTAAPPDGYVLFLGTLEPRKNVGTLLDAYERLATGRQQVPTLVLAGKETEAARPWLDRLARPPLLNIARHIGYVDPGKRRPLYEGARLLVQPSHEEGFGLPVLEAMTLGVPVVAANRGALPEVVGNAGSLFDPDDADALAAAIGRMLDDASYASACTSRGIARAREFTWTETARRVLDAYRLAVEHRACASA